jgi:hypothetical protein
VAERTRTRRGRTAISSTSRPHAKSEATGKNRRSAACAPSAACDPPAPTPTSSSPSGLPGSRRPAHDRRTRTRRDGGTARSETGRCGFCGSAAGPAARVYAPGGWVACRACAQIIERPGATEARRRRDLARRAARAAPGPTGRGALATCPDRALGAQRDFWERYRPPAPTANPRYPV